MSSTSSVITIGREFGSAGSDIGQEIAKHFGIKYYDKELLEHAANESGICRELFDHHDEKPTNSFLYSLVMDSYSFGYSSAGFTDMPMNHKIFLAQFDAIKELAEELNKVKGPVIVILDSCHSGAAIADKSTDDPLRLFTQSAVSIFSGYRMNPTALDITDKSSELATGKFTVMAAAAYSETSTSLIYDDIAFGAFTYALMDGMGCDYPSGTYGGSMPADSDREDGRITLNEIFTYVLRYTKDWDLSQTAQRYGDGARVLFSR